MQKQRAKMLEEKVEGRSDHSLVLPILRLFSIDYFLFYLCLFSFDS